MIETGRSPAWTTLALGLVLLVAPVVEAEAAKPTGRSPVSHRELVERAFAVCATASNRIGAIRPATTLRASAATTAAVIVHLQRVITKLDALYPPPVDRQPLRRYVSLLEQEVAFLVRGKDAARRRDRAAFADAYQDAAGVSLRARSIADRLGLAVCGTL